MKEPDQLAQVAREIAEGDWLADAQARARRRKSAWNLLLPLLGLPLWGAVVFCLIWAASQVHMLLRGGPGNLHEFMAGPMHASTFLVLVPSLLAGVAPAMILANFLVFRVPPARRAMEAEDRDFPGLAYGPSQVALVRLGGWFLLGWSATTLLACAFP